MGEMDIMASGPASETVADAADADGEAGIDMDAIGGRDGSGSCGFSGPVSGVWGPTGWSGRRRVPLFGLGSRPRESQTML